MSDKNPITTSSLSDIWKIKPREDSGRNFLVAKREGGGYGIDTTPLERLPNGDIVARVREESE